MGKLTDKQKKEIIADKADGMSLRKIAAKFSVSPHTIKKALDDDPETARLCAQKKEQNTLDMLAFLDSRLAKAQELVELLMEEMANPEKISRASEQMLATAMGIIIDKFVATKPKQEDEGVVIVWGRR